METLWVSITKFMGKITAKVGKNISPHQ